MISSVIQYDSILVVRDENGQTIGTISTGGGEFIGYSNTFILLRYGNMYSTVDENQRPLGSTILPDDYEITGITNNGSRIPSLVAYAPLVDSCTGSRPRAR